MSKPPAVAGRLNLLALAPPGAGAAATRRPRGSSIRFYRVGKHGRMTDAEDAAFTEFLLQKAAEAETRGMARRVQMLAAQGGESTVRQLLSKGKPSDGFTRLWELGRLDLTVEAGCADPRHCQLVLPAQRAGQADLLRLCARVRGRG
jgi:hypothetical protein